jgi:hypothetical protein
MPSSSVSARVLAVLLAFAVLLSGQLVLSGCEVDHETEADGDESVRVTVDGEAVDRARDNLNAAGDAIEDAAAEAAEAIDENVDVGDNAGTPEVDDGE